LPGKAASPVRVAIVNDYPIVVAGLAVLLEPHVDRIHVVELDAGCPVGRDVDVILHDAFAYTDGLAGFVASPARVIVFTFIEAPEAVAQAMSQGAAGYVFKGLPIERLVGAIERVHAGEKVVELRGEGPSTPGIESAEPGCWPGQEVGLTARESEILTLICQGLSNHEIAARTYLSINSVKTYIRTAYRKIHVTTRPQAVLWGARHGFTPETMRILPLP
jgi:DNA-binding NarL/FixJ family response regulator